MSSATSTKVQPAPDAVRRSKTGAPPSPAASAAGSSRPGDASGFRPWHFFVLASLMAATVGVALAHGSSPANLVLVSVAIGASGCASLGFYRMLAPLVVDDVRLTAESLGARTRATLEREKMLVLRTIKELEFDRAMGKVSAQDFDDMVGRLRSRAIALMKQLDQAGSGYRELIEREVLTRIGPAPARARAAVAEAQPAIAEPEAPPHVEVAETKAAGRVDSAAGEVTPSIRACPACGTANDADARFCKHCGARQREW